VGSIRSAEVIHRLIDDDQLALLSFMDHTPGQGQFKTVASYLNFFVTNYKLSKSEVMLFVEKKMANRAKSWSQTTDLADHACEKGIPILSHDDDTEAKVALLKSLHVSGSEFPVTMEAASYAKKQGLSIFMGAPNLIRGQSTNGNLSATDILSRKMLSGLISDYYPESLLQGPFVAQAALSLELEDTLALTTSGPSNFLVQDQKYGRLIAGAKADIIVIDTKPSWKKVMQTWVGGQRTYCSANTGKGMWS
jgi:alpha-D-ribose 1-methylphosphonate 5-triphosphate diphosphatase